jgi:hypothetical protein
LPNNYRKNGWVLKSIAGAYLMTIISGKSPSFFYRNMGIFVVSERCWAMWYLGDWTQAGKR